MANRSAVVLALVALTLIPGCYAGPILLTGSITQSVQDGTGPAVNNPSLNAIQDLQSYTVGLPFSGLLAPGTYDLTGAALTFNVPGAAASETAFGMITLAIMANGAFDDITLKGCLTSGDCSSNFLSASFQIPAASLNSPNVAVTGLDQPHPFELLEDDGGLDIHGSIATFTAVPEPSYLALVGCFFVAAAVARRRVSISGNKPKRRKPQ